MRRLLYLWFVLCAKEVLAVEGVESLEYRGFKGCYRLSNSKASVILVPESGSRVLAYSIADRNVMYENRAFDGKSLATMTESFDPDGGRFDLGPEITIPRHLSLWIGAYEAQVVGDRRVRLTSEKDPATGCQIVRDFALDKDSSHLRVEQRVTNVSDKPVEWCFWSRTLAKGGGVCIVPLNPFSRFPQGWAQYAGGGIALNPPKQEHVEVREGCLVLTTAPQIPKYGLDSYAGWMAYVVDGLLFAKRFRVEPEGYYKDAAGFTVEVYITPDMCELEPLSVAKRLRPGQSLAFAEDWWLLDYPKRDPAEVSPADVERVVMALE